MSYHAMKRGSSPRQAASHTVSQVHSKLPFDYAAYPADYRDRFGRAYFVFRARH